MRASEFISQSVICGYQFPDPKSEDEIEHEKLNGIMPSKAWYNIFIVMLENRFGNILHEAVNADTKQIIKNLEESFKLTDLKSHNYYAVVPIFVVENNIIICNAEGDSNSQHNSKMAKFKFFKNDKMYFSCPGKIVEYPILATDRPISYSTALVMGSIEKYDELRMLIKLYFSLDMPEMTK